MESLTRSTLGPISRDSFMELCPTELKEKIEDFLLHYNERKASKGEPKTFSGSSKPVFKKGNGGGGVPFRKSTTPKSRTEFENFLGDFKGILSKVSDTNRSTIWSELCTFRIQRCFPDYVPNMEPVVKKEPTVDSGWKAVGKRSTNKTVTATTPTTSVDKAIPCEPTSWRELVDTIYMYTKNCSMYYRDYIDILVNLKSQPNMSEFVQYYTELALRDFAEVLKCEYEDEMEVEEQLMINTLVCRIIGELFMTGCLSKRDYVSKSILPLWTRITSAVEKHTGCEHHLEVFLVLIQSGIKGIYKDKGFLPIQETMKGWVNKKMFSGKTHYSLMDTLDKIPM